MDVIKALPPLALTLCCTNAWAADAPVLDWAELGRYREANAALGPPKAGEARVVLMGDSITEGWSRLQPEFFADPARVNRGISGQTTPQMLVRFRPDVIALQPSVVVILAGTNDIAGNTGPTTEAEIAGNIASMVELAQAHGIRVVLLSVLPASHYPWNPAVREPSARIIALNRLLAEYAARHKIAWVDLHTPMADKRQGLKAELGYDAVHPNEAGYRAMRGPVEAALGTVLRRP
jgi:lysophospholipase L1-like esterase